MPAAYPAHREADVALRDGGAVHVRPARPSDRESLHAFLRGLSRDSLFFRFFSLGANLEAAAKWAADVDYEHSFGLIATSGR